MSRPALLRMMPMKLRERLYFSGYHTRHEAWRHLFTRAPLALCPEIAMHNLIPGDVISACVAFNGFYELELSRQMLRLAALGGLLVDVGANMGYFSLLWAGLNSAARVVAFEASPRNVALLQNNVRQNHLDDRVTVVLKAMGNRAGTVTFDVGPVDRPAGAASRLGLPQIEFQSP